MNIRSSFMLYSLPGQLPGFCIVCLSEFSQYIMFVSALFCLFLRFDLMSAGRKRSSKMNVFNLKLFGDFVVPIVYLCTSIFGLKGHDHRIQEGAISASFIFWKIL